MWLQLIAALCIVAAFIFTTIVKTTRKLQHNGQHRTRTPSIEEAKGIVLDPYLAIDPVEDGFDLEKTEPIQLRPFKPKYFLTMALQNTTMSDLIAMDKTHHERLKLRQQLIKDHPASTIQCKPLAEPAVRELYQWLMVTYLPRRYPGLYRLSSTNTDGEKQQLQTLEDLTSGTSISTDPSSLSPLECLCRLGQTIDTEFLILLPSSTAPDGSPTYHLEAFVNCFPSGFSTLAKLGMTLADIHGPVPGYADKLAKSMDRFFEKLEVGKIIKRANWSVTTDDVLFCESGTHIHEEESSAEAGADAAGGASPSADEEIEKAKAQVKVEDCRVRCERQTLHRLPQTKALVFAFKTYQYRIEDVKAEGNGLLLADAIEGLTKGNVPAFNVYKRGIVWGEKVTEFLRS